MTLNEIIVKFNRLLVAFKDMRLEDGSFKDEMVEAISKLPMEIDQDVNINEERTESHIDNLNVMTRKNEQDIRSLEAKVPDGQILDDDPTIFIARIDQEAGSGEYDEWAEVITDDGVGGFKTKPNGLTSITTGWSLWEANGVTGIAVGTYVIVHIVPGDNLSYTFVHKEDPTGYVEPAGLVKAYAGDTIPSGHLLCDGTSYLRATYPGLFTAIGTLWGSVDGTHFNVPDLGELSIRGWKQSSILFGTVGNTGGVAVLDLVHVHSYAGCIFLDTPGGDTMVWDASTAQSTTWQGTSDPPTVDKPDGNSEVDNRGPYGVCKWIIKT